MTSLLTPTGGAGTTPVLPGKNLTAIDLEATKLRPKIVSQEREILYENVLKQKLHNNAYRDENTKLKTRLAIFEVELRQRERVIDELLVKPDAYANLTSGATTSAIALATVGGNFAKMKKFESHLTQNLKRRIKEMQRRKKCRTYFIQERNVIKWFIIFCIPFALLAFAEPFLTLVDVYIPFFSI